MKVVETCPLGKKCIEWGGEEEKTERCKWYMCFRVTDQDGKSGEDWQCAMTWNAVLQAELLDMMRYQMKENKPNEKSRIIS